MFKTMFNAPAPKLAKMDSHSKTIPGQSKTIREMFEKYVATGIPMSQVDGEYYENESPIDPFGVELEDTPDFAQRVAETRASLENEEAKPAEPTSDPGEEETP